jgi:hypothetical protein
MNNITFAGYEWKIRSTNELIGPVPNYYSPKCISIQNNELRVDVLDENGILFMRRNNINKITWLR